MQTYKNILFGMCIEVFFLFKSLLFSLKHFIFALEIKM